MHSQSAMIFVVICISLEDWRSESLCISLCPKSAMSYARYSMEGCFWGSKNQTIEGFLCSVKMQRLVNPKLG